MGIKSEKWILAVLVVFSLFVSSIGINFGLPSSKKTKKIISPDWDTEELFDALSSSWKDIYNKYSNIVQLLEDKDSKYDSSVKKVTRVVFDEKLPPANICQYYRAMIIHSKHSDEGILFSSLSKIKPLELKFKPHSFIYGGGFIYPMGAYYLALSKLGIIKKMSMRQTLENPDSLAKFYTTGRLLSVISFMGICFIGFLLTKRLSDFNAGVFSFIIIMTTPIMLIYAHYLLPHLWSTFWAMASIFFVLRAMPSIDLKNMILAGVCLGISAGSYWSQLHIVFFIAAILCSADRQVFTKSVLKRISIGLAVSAFTFIALNPYLPMEWKTCLKEFIIGDASIKNPNLIKNFVLFFTQTLPKSIGAVYTMLIFLGYAWGLLSRNKIIKNLSISCAILMAIISLSTPGDVLGGTRRFFPWLIISLLLASMFIKSMLFKLPKFFRALGLFLCVLPGLLIYSGYMVGFTEDSTPKSTFSQMANALDSINPKTSLGILRFPYPTFTPYFRMDKWNIVVVNARDLALLKTGELPKHLLVNFDQKKRILKTLETKYKSIYNFHPKKIFGFNPNPHLSLANAPIELYELKD